MKIIVNEPEVAYGIIHIIEAVYLGDYKITVHFDDGKEQHIDFEPFLKKAQHPEIKKYLDKTLFSAFRIVDGNLDWNNMDMVFPVADLYEGSI